MSLRLGRMLAIDAANCAGSYPNIAVFMGRFEVSERTVRGTIPYFRYNSFHFVTVDATSFVENSL